MEAICVPKRDIVALVSRTFPHYRGRKFTVKVSPTVRLTGLHWSGGSRTEYAFVRVDGAAVTLDFSRIAPWAHNQEGQVVTLPADVCCVQHDTFCGRDCGIRVVFSPETPQHLLPSVLRPALTVR